MIHHSRMDAYSYTPEQMNVSDAREIMKIERGYLGSFFRWLSTCLWDWKGEIINHASMEAKQYRYFADNVRQQATKDEYTSCAESLDEFAITVAKL